MKKILLTVYCCFPILVSAQQKSRFEIRGQIGNWSAPARVYLIYMANETTRVVDTVAIKNGEFTATGAVEDVTMAWLMLDREGIGYNNLNPSNSDYTGLYVYNEKIMLRAVDSMKNIKAENTPLNDEGRHYYAVMNDVMVKENTLQQEWNALPEDKKTAALREDWKKRSDAAAKEVRRKKEDYIREKPGSYFSLLSLQDLINEKQNPDDLTKLYNTLTPEWQNSKMGKQLASDIEALHKTTIGKSAPAFSLPDQNGKTISLSQFKGKYVLVDFWASWCMPCRAENPNVVKAYDQYHPKGLEILGVSLDDNNYKTAWTEAIRQDGLVWTQVNDFKGFRSEAAQRYAVKSIPQNFLIDPKGVIVAVNLRAGELGKKLEALLGK